MDTFNINTWHTVPLLQVERLPASPGVYAAMLGDSPLYIGKSQNLKQRLKWHARAVELATRGVKDLRYITLLESEITGVEAELIERHQPLLNIRVKPFNTPERRELPLSTCSYQGTGPCVMAEAWHCGQCDHVWLNYKGMEPTHCARCKSRSWKKFSTGK